MSALDDPPLVTSVDISIYELLDLIFSTNTHPEIRSRIAGDPYHPVVISKALEARLNSLPAALEIFHIESYPSHAELWYRREWKDSASLKHKLRSQSAAYIASAAILSETERRREQAFSIIYQTCRDKFKMPATNANALATNITTSFNVPGVDWAPVLEALHCEHVKPLLQCQS